MTGIRAEIGQSLAGLLSAGDRTIRGFGLRRLRLSTGLILFAYVGSHLTNHALGNASVDAMETGLIVQKWIWQSVLGTVALYLALGTHLSLGIWALYERRYYGWRTGEVVQLVLGISIPLLLAHHLTVTRIDQTLFGTEKGYAQELYSFWVKSPNWGLVQVFLLIVAWIHGCIGVFYWLRLKPTFQNYASVLLAAAILLPVLALLGFVQGGRVITALATEPSWRAINLDPAHAGTPVENALLETVYRWITLGFVGLVALTILARGARVMRERTHRFISLRYPDGRVAKVPLGFSVLEASLSAKIPHACICGGRARCSTCRIRVLGDPRHLPPPDEVEKAVLQRTRAGPSVRLACQLRPAGDLAVVPLVPAHISLGELRRRTIARGGQERFIVVMVVDLRDSSQLPLRHMPFDAVFAIGCFLEEVGRAITEAGGQPNQFTGDGLLAMFGIDCTPDEACRGALRAAAQIAANIAALNELMAIEWAEPVRFGIGVHGGEAIVGEVGYRDNIVFTALGEPPNVASRLEAQCKEFGCELVISEDVCAASGLALANFPLHSIRLRGREDPIAVRTVAHAADLTKQLALITPVQRGAAAEL